MKNPLRSLYLILSIALLAYGAVARAAEPEPDIATKLDKRLVPIAASAEKHYGPALQDASLLRQTRQINNLLQPRWNAAGQVQVYLHYAANEAAPDREQLASLGATGILESPELGVIEAWVPAPQLRAVSELPGVLRVSLPQYVFHKRFPTQSPVTYTGSRNTQGDSILQASAFRKSTGDTGQGVAVGVISDGDQNISAAQKTGDLPSGIWDDPKNKGGKGGFSPPSSGDEGTAMMEIIYDLAPGVSRLGFCGPQTTVDFITCLNDFKNNISPNVIVDDLGFPGGAMFSEDSFTSGIQSFVRSNPSIHLVTAAGNEGSGFWQGTWTPTTVSSTANSISYTQAMDFGGGNPDLQLNVRPGDVITYIVEWDDPWSDTATANDPNDFDVVVFDGPNGSGTAVACNQGINIGPDPSNAGSTECNQTNSQNLSTPGPQPVQGSQWTAAQSTYYLEVFGVHGSLANKRIKILVLDQSAFQVIVSPSTPGSVYGHAALAEPNEITVGAVYPRDLTLESYSSTGPVEMGTGGSHTSVSKPDFVAPDCVSVTGAGGFENPFCGTSAAAPHIAGLMALLISGYPGTAPYKLLQKSATPKGTPVPNGQFGYGLPNMKTLLNKGLRPTVKKSSGGGGMDLFDILALALALMATSRYRRSAAATGI